MHNPAPFFNGTSYIFDKSTNLKQRPFFNQLFNVSNEKCVEFTGLTLNSDAIKVCRNEVMVAASCVLLSKTNNQYGDFRNNVFRCKHEINIVKKALSKNYSNFEEEKFDKWLSKLDLSIRSFV
jgi:hypothetical protein